MVSGASDFSEEVRTENDMPGVNTGFGGSANTHTDQVEKLQRNLIRFLNCGVIATPSVDDPNEHCQERWEYNAGHMDLSKFRQALPNQDLIASTTMPESWVRATLLVRGNSLSRGSSGVRPELLNSLVRLVNKRVTPIIPLRGSISASGDLIPLSYIAATLQGSSEVEVWMNNETGHLGRQRVTADVALATSSLAPIHLGPKEGLAMVNGTAVSAGVGSLAIHGAHGLIILSQVLTAMGVEALRGSVESFDSFFSEIRPHAGQREVSSNIRSFLKGSTLLSDKEEDYANGDCLRQDRYSIRTAPQWLGPQLEDIVLADKQISTELNSTTDNPVIDWQNEEFLHGGNFQAMAVTSAMEKTRSVLHVIGRLLFAQSSELINPVFNNGLPPNLTADEPSQSFLFKGIDINIASLQAELGFLSAPMPPHVQNAEMGNQSVNSLALLSARYTHIALDILSQMSAAYLLTLCQALDLRALHIRFLAALEPDLRRITFELFEPLLRDVDVLHHTLWLRFKKTHVATIAVDSSQRFVQIMQTLQQVITTHAILNSKDGAGLIPAIDQWTASCASLCLGVFRSTTNAYVAEPDASEILGSASKRMYKFVRSNLSIPFQTASCADSKPLGALLSKINSAIQNGILYVPVMDCLRESLNLPEPMMTPNKSLEKKYGSRLILHLIDDIARDDPNRCFCLLSTLAAPDGFRTVSYGELANAINRVAWWIGENTQKDLDFQTLGYIGPSDLRYTILTIAAQKAGFKVISPAWLE